MPGRAKPETLRLRSLTPTFTVNDIGESLRWYTQVLGFTVAETFDDDDGQLVAAALKAGTVELFLGQDDWKKGRDREKGTGFRLYCATAQDVDQLAADIAERGGRIDTPPTDRPWGTREFAITDPDGFRLTISTPRP